MTNNIAQGLVNMLNQEPFADKGEQTYWGYVSFSGLEEHQDRDKTIQAIIAGEVDELFMGVCQRVWIDSGPDTGPIISAETFGNELLVGEIEDMLRTILRDIRNDLDIPDIDYIAQEMSTKRDVTTNNISHLNALGEQFIFTLKWRADDVFKFSLAVVPLDMFVSNALTGKSKCQPYLMYENGNWTGTYS